MTTPGRSPLGDAAEADVADQHRPVVDIDEESSWGDTAHVAADRDWQASEADLIDQAIGVPDDESDFER